MEDRSEDIIAVDLARNLMGDVVVAWRQPSSSGEFLWLKRFVNGAWDQAPYSAPAGVLAPGITFPVTQILTETHVGMEVSGVAQLLYIGADLDLHWIRWSGESAASVPAPTVVPGTTGDDFPLGLAVSDGFSTVVWVDPPEGYKVSANKFVLNQWTTPQPVVPPTDNAAEIYFEFASNATDYVLAVFRSGTNDDALDRSVQTYIATDGTVTTPDPIQLPGMPVTDVELVLDRADSATALITLPYDAMRGAPLYGARYTAAANAWTTPVPLTSGRATRVELITTGNGTARAVWFEPTEGTTKGRLVTRTCTDAGWSDAITLTGEISLLAAGLAVSSNERGSAIVVWAQSDEDDRKSFQFVRFTRDAGWSMPGEIGAFGGDGAIIGVTLADDGRALLLWTEAPTGTRFRDLKWSRSN